MRWLTLKRRPEQGATAVLVALLMIPLIGMVALAVDTGAMYWEKAQLQNGADAAALGFAQNCGRQNNLATDSPALARTLAAQNANDSLVNVGLSSTACTGTITVNTSTLNKTGTTVYHPLATAVGLGPTTERATATAQWWAPSAGTSVLPVAMAASCLSQTTYSPTSIPQFLPLTNPSGSPSNKAATSCATAAYPSGFGWLANTCSVSVAIGWVNAVPGKSFPPSCSSVVSALLGQTVMVPIYDNYRSQGSNGQFHVIGFAGFQITGWAFTGNNNHPDPTGAACGQSCNGIWGRFVYWSTSAPAGSVGGGPNLGYYFVELTN